MPAVIKELEPLGESRGALRAICISQFLDGECYAFATALHRGLGWPLVGLMEDTVVRHAAVRSPSGELHDARGMVPFSYFGTPFGHSVPYALRVITEADLGRAGEPEMVREHSISVAGKLAEALWPQLPWKESLASRALAFAEELEALSRKHKLWIRSPYPAALPLLALGEDDEGGYTLRRTDDGIAFTIDRYF